MFVVIIEVEDTQAFKRRFAALDDNVGRTPRILEALARLARVLVYDISWVKLHFHCLG